MERSRRATGKPRRRFGIPKRTAAIAGTAAVVMAMLGGIPAAAAVPTVGNGFVVTPSDLAFILKQIRISERHAATQSAPDHVCDTLIGPAADQIPDALTSYGLRTVDGSCNNLIAGRETFAAADQTFPRLTKPDFDSPPSPDPTFPVPSTATYRGTGNVVDTQPRVASNLIVDQTSTNPAAIAAAEFPVRSQGGNSVLHCTTDPVLTPDGTAVVTPGVPADCVPSHQTLFIENVTTDVGLSPPYNSLFTFFGQFFDHGVDQTVKSGNAVFVPLKADDPLIAGKDHILGNTDDLPPSQRFMVLTRAQTTPGDPNQNATNTDSPWVDQSQTYTSHSSHQVFLREYSAGTGTPSATNPAAISTGKFLGGLAANGTYPGSPDGTDGISTWASVKQQARTLLGLDLHDSDVTNIPLLATDPYGNFLPGPNGLPQYVTRASATSPIVLVEGNRTSPVAVPPTALHFDTPFLTDIAHNADPSPQDTDNIPTTPPVAPRPDDDTVPSADFAHQPAGTYDDELLNAHFACGDGRCNENIALSSIHQIFHSEHNRLVDDITNTLNDPANAALKADYQASHVDGPTVAGGKDMSFGYGGRLFQAARFVTEMEYQHLVFEEFARKVQPAVRPFHVYSPDINPAIEAEFAHAVYRFGHSMLDDQVARTTVDATGKPNGDASLPLLTAFLNPPMYFNTKADAQGNPDPTGTTLNAQQAAGAIVMGSADQAGNELDEFVTETLRNNLLGLPLDLPTINMARAREAGVPRLNDVRRQINAQTNDGQLAPYTDWSDFGNHLKHPQSLINYVAAYGTHPTITSATTLAAKRLAARAIVDPFPGQAAIAADPTATPPVVGQPAIPADVQPADAGAFMFGTDGRDPACATCRDWRNVGGKTVTGLDDVDLWVGGLGEVTNLFGGLLGSTFNYVFQTQLEKLQDGDRLYYLARTPGMNLRTQLEGNSFSEMIVRNTDGATNTLKADAFATADCKFQLSFLNDPANSPNTAATPPVPGALIGAGTVKDDPATVDCNENLLLQKQPDGTIAYRQRNTVDPSGINGQSVYNGTTAVDRIKGGNDNDTVWGDDGNDVIDGQGGDDDVLGGNGNDIITDLDGADVPKGGPGNDAIDAGPGDDIPMGNAGQDFINGGSNDNETFAGPGNDFVIAGQGADAVFGDGGDDWIEGGSGQDLLQGDHGAPFFDDPAQTAPGNDVFIDQVGESDYDAEGGDDVMAQNVAVDRNAGAGGFDWAIHQYDVVFPNTTAPPAVDDMMINNNLNGLPQQVIINRDRWQETEADSGGPGNDTIKGTDGVLSTPRLITGGGFTGCDALDATGVARVSGLADLLPPVTSWVGTAAETSSLSVSGFCPLTGPVWGEGDILLGGPGNDTITGRTGDEIIDGDKEMNVAISVRTDPKNAATEVGRTDLMENTATSGTFGTPAVPVPASMTLQQAVFAGLVDPGNLVAVRAIVDKATTAPDCGVATPVNCDTATFAGPRAQYTITTAANGSVKVADNTSTPPTVAVPATGDGTDTLFNVERLQFTDQTVNVVVPPTPTITSVVPGNASATVNFTVPSTAGITSFTITVRTGTTVRAITGIPVPATGTSVSRLVTGLTNGTPSSFTVNAVTALGAGPESAPVSATPVAPAVAPTVNAGRTPAVNATAVGVGTNISVTFSRAVTGVSATSFRLNNAVTGALIAAPVAVRTLGTNTWVLNPTNNLATDTRYTVTLTGGATAIRDATTNTPLVATPTQPLSWSFTTGPAPTVTGRTPAVNAVGVARTGNISATFSEAITGVSGTSFRLTNAVTGAVIAAPVAVRTPGTNTWVLNPTPTLAANTLFRVTLTGGAAAIRDAANNPLTTVTWTFRTGAV